MTADEVVRRHAAGDYVVHMVGFLPGFAYLGGLDPRLATPRRATPRTVVPAGSVGIGGQQTGVYPMDSPGGWHLIGRTELRLFDPRRDPPTLLRAGDRVRFRPLGA
jgi:KipI family sensor histidine kinase inhibitor